MFAEAHFPKYLNPETLDQYLEQGWFRMGQTIFTTNFLNLRDEFYSAIWLRILLSEFSEDKRQKKLMKMNAGFDMEIRPASITAEKELLFSKYKRAISFDASPSLQHLMFGHETYNIYNTFEVNLFDRGHLIACGFFDIGKKSAAGITSFYDPDFKKYSLGKFLIYLKINHCKALGLQYFYPGYFAPGYVLFDYKLQMGTAALEYFQLTSNTWVSIKNFLPVNSPLQVMYGKLQALRGVLSGQIELRKYAYFEANLLAELEGMSLFDYPIFLLISEKSPGGIIVAVYNVIDSRYSLIRCQSLWKASAPAEQDIYSSDLLKVEEELYSTDSESKMAIAIKELKVIDLTTDQNCAGRQIVFKKT
jgi:leucyl-tRNA---protein transferase